MKLRMKHWLVLAWLTWAASSVSAQSIAFSFDDGFDPRVTSDAATLNRALLSALAREHVQAALFPAGIHVDSPAGLALVRDWGEAGHAVGNHTYSHFSLASDAVTLTEFCADVTRNEGLLRANPGWTKRLRFPYLKEGNTLAKRDGFRDWMATHGYRPAPVSIDASDWYYDQRFVAWSAHHPGEDPAPFRAAYLAHLLNRARYYDSLAQAVLGRSPTHVILLHTNRINATFLPDILAMFKAEGWKIASIDEAFSDPLYARQPAVLPAGESIVWSLAFESGLKTLRYPAEDDVYEKPILDALGL